VFDWHHLRNGAGCAASECQSARGTGGDAIRVTACSVTDAERDGTGKGNSDD
jgi:hypothetical protein